MKKALTRRQFGSLTYAEVRAVFEVLQRLKIIEPGVAKYIRKNPRFFKHRGGFKLARVSYYFTDTEREAIRGMAGENSCYVGNSGRRPINFMDFVNEQEG